MHMLIIFCLIIFIICLILAVVGWYFTNITYLPKIKSLEEIYNREEEKGIMPKDFYNMKDSEIVTIKSDYGYDLIGLWFNNKESKDTVIVCHGYGVNYMNSIKYGDMFYELGYNVLVYNHRFHGDSGGNICTFGYYEKNDLKKCVDFVIEKVGEKGIIGTHGESMGAAIVLQHAAIDKRIDFIIADCSFSTLRKQLEYRLKVEYRLPSFPVVDAANMMSKVRCGMYYRDISPVKSVKEIESPILFVHGEKDEYIPFSHVEELFKNKQGNKELYVGMGSDHATSYEDNIPEYRNQVNNFLKKYELIK